ncbi:STAS domain-containing protein [Streptomyces candidus]|uniref:Anti-anti-sigma factor n=1 Tax=Streptomyces candidus TaxID=67283 RepID=A0A7X0LT54_9ACTN|nr:STAS domain-containing protein [Streptomyces candidus]MBB6438661.1 anti-anti-sigma factor [Streptomyces candidus]GHH45143.1 hypothetical protein GCM10018773_33920 [Streptomyces candidus]
MTVRPFTSHAAVHSGVARVTLAGELDLDTAFHVRDTVAACLVKQPTEVRLDLTGVSFCDCSGLNALLAVRSSALRAGVGLRVEGIGTQPARLLALIGADGLFAERASSATAVPAPCAAEADTRRPDAAMAVAEKAPLRGLLA